MGKRAKFLSLLGDWQFHQHYRAGNKLSKIVIVFAFMEETVPNPEFVGCSWCLPDARPPLESPSGLDVKASEASSGYCSAVAWWGHAPLTGWSEWGSTTHSRRHWGRGGPSRPMLHATVLSPSAANPPLPTLTPLYQDSGEGRLTQDNSGRWKSEGGRRGTCRRWATEQQEWATVLDAHRPLQPLRSPGDQAEKGTKLLPTLFHFRNPRASGCVCFSFWYYQP